MSEEKRGQEERVDSKERVSPNKGSKMQEPEEVMIASRAPSWICVNDDVAEEVGSDDLQKEREEKGGRGQLEGRRRRKAWKTSSLFELSPSIRHSTNLTERLGGEMNGWVTSGIAELEDIVQEFDGELRLRSRDEGFVG